VQSTETPGITQGNSSVFSIPATIETRGNKGKKPALAVVPEGQTVEDSTISASVLASETHHTDEGDVKKMKVVELKEALKERGLSTDGIKFDLQSRLLEAVIRDIPDEEDEEEEISSTTTSKRKHSSDVSTSGRHSIRSSSTKRTKAGIVEEDGVPKKRGPGRPKKEEGITKAGIVEEEDVPKKRGPGRPKKEEGITADTTPPLKKGPGRPKKVDKEQIELVNVTKGEEDESVSSRAISTRIGRTPEPPKSQNKKESMDDNDSAGTMPPSRKRGRPPKNPSSTSARGRGKTVDGGESVASSRRSTRSVASKATTDSASMSTRRSNRRAK
jgi:hypothetical protein